VSVLLAAPCRFETEIKRSRFIAHASPVENEAATLDYFEAVADQSANHNCWAWRINGRYRSSDDGEPGGTAGRPILAVLEGRDIDRVMVVVTRFFGGIRLGVGGLIRAYGGSAAKCIDQGQLVQQLHWRRCEITADFALADLLHQLLAQSDARKTGETYTDKGLRLELEVPQEQMETLRGAVETLSRGQAKLWLSR